MKINRGMVGKLKFFPTPVFIFVISMLLTFLTAAYVYLNSRNEDQLSLERAALVTRQRIDDQLNDYLALLRGTAGLYSAKGDVSYDEFSAYISRLRLHTYYQGIQGIGFARKTSPAELPAVVANIRNSYNPDYSIRPVGEREVYFPIVYLLPLDTRNRAAMGYDMYSEETRREAMKASWIEGTAKMSGKVTLVQEVAGDVQAGFLMYVPVFEGGKIPATKEDRERLLKGFVYSPFRAGDFISGIAEQSRLEGVDFVIYDGRDVSPEAIIYAPKNSIYTNDSHLNKAVPVKIGGREWTIKVYANNNFNYSDQRKLIPYLILVGVGISTLLYLLTRSQYESRDKIAAILNSITDGFYAVDKNWNFTYLNSEAVEALSKRESNLRGKNMWNVFPELNNTKFGPAYKQVMKSKKPVTVEDFFPPLNAWFEARVYPSGTGISVYFQDITKRKELENQKDEFLGIASHELKTPVTSVKAYGQLLERTFKAKGNKEAVDMLNKMNKQINKLSVLIGDLLDVSRIQSGKIQFRMDYFDIFDLVNEVVDGIESTTRQQINVKAPKRVKPVYGDSDRIGQVLTNLLSNAIKYSSGAKKIDVTVKAEKSEVSVCVRDYGIGIPKKEQRKIFERFYRAKDAKLNNFSGVGLGLYISNEIVRRHSGKMTVTSQEGNGAEFCFTIPYKPSNEKK